MGVSHAETEATETTYIVKKGDWLAKIAPNFGTTWKAIAKANNIKKPYIIHPDQKLRIPHQANTVRHNEVSKTTTPFLWKKPGHAKCKKCELHASVKGLGFPDVVETALIAKVENREFTMIEIAPGMHFDAMYFGKRIRKENVIASWPVGHTEPAREYSIIHNGTRYALVYPLVCGNWSKTTSTVVLPPIAASPPVKEIPVAPPVHDDRVAAIASPQPPEPTLGKIIPPVCATCPDFIVLAVFEPRKNEESNAPQSGW